MPFAMFSSQLNFLMRILTVHWVLNPPNDGVLSMIKKIKKMETNKLFYGIDVGSQELVKTQGIQQVSDKFVKLPSDVLANTLSSISEWVKTLPSNAHVIFEYTGTYSLNLAYCLEIADIAFTAINPMQSKAFAQVMKITSQNDSIDASLLAYYGLRNQPERTSLESEHLHQMKQKRKHLSTLMADKRAVENRLHALSFDIRADKSVIESLELLQKTYEIQEQLFKDDLFTLNDQEYNELYERMTSVVGIGPASANAMILATNGFKNFTNVKQVLKFLGIVPQEKSSGKTVHKKSGLVKSGVGYVRAILYMAARSAKRCNLACIEIYNHQRAKGKAHKVAMVAVMSKMVRQVFGVVKNQTIFVNNYEFAK